MDRGWILDDDDIVNVTGAINMRILIDIAKAYQQPGRLTTVEIRHNHEHIKEVHLLKEEIASLERIYNVAFNFSPDLK
ncbi:Uncharacterized [Syntrophomonas zehnderi OL-4]|uniref:Uncharacterized n=1 Tax=Syntrophomonas zehnderi OL-4 TaxID=690567 RepID=A0A0E4G9Q4_9FIRM|nr:hypothetical protein [Syntrophomonas zehnderi]CFX21382.1 Uncharacterized [Syntrophomonas zehnderi OL-4]